MLVWSRNICLQTKILGSLFFVAAVVSANLAYAQGGGGGNTGGFGFNRVVGGVSVDAQGVLTGDMQKLSTADIETLGKKLASGDPRVNKAGYRALSLKAVEEALAAATKDGKPISPEIQFMAGLQRIEYVVAKPEQGDILLVGPGEGWKVNERGSVVGEKSGQPVLLLEDFLVAMRTVDDARRDMGISVDIRPSEEGIRRRDKVLAQAVQVRQFDSVVAQTLEQATGLQAISVTGVPTDSHYAQVLVTADYQMKRLSMGFEKALIENFPSLLDLIQQNGGISGRINPRFWMACHYDALSRSEDGLVWKLNGQGVKALTEETFYDANGQVVQGKKAKSNKQAEKWAKNMTERFEELSAVDSTFRELRNVMDMSVVGALIAKENLFKSANLVAPELTQMNSAFATPTWQPASAVPSKCSFIYVNTSDSWTVTTSGGVQVDSWAVVENQKVDAKLSEIADQTNGLDLGTSVFCNLSR